MRWSPTRFNSAFDVLVRDGRPFRIEQISIANEATLRQSLPQLRQVGPAGRESLGQQLDAWRLQELIGGSSIDYTVWGARPADDPSANYVGVACYAPMSALPGRVAASVHLDPARSAPGLGRLLLETITLVGLVHGVRRLDIELGPWDVELRQFVTDVDGLVHAAAPDRLQCTIDLAKRRKLRTSLEFPAPVSRIRRAHRA